jgi:2-keto-4-pentenoate hydratase
MSGSRNPRNQVIHTMEHEHAPSPSVNGAELASLLIRARQMRQPVAIPAALSQPVNPERAYELQRLHASTFTAQFGGHAAVMKLGGGDMATMAALGLTGPYRGPIFSQHLHDSPARVRRADFLDLCMVECEIAFLLSDDIGSDGSLPDRESLSRAIGAIVPCIEIADSRFANPVKAPPEAILADFAFSGGWVRGRTVRDWRSIDLGRLSVTLSCNGSEIRRGVGALAATNPLDNLRAALADMGRTGEQLRAGQIVSAGTYTPGYMARHGDALVADFGALGQVSLEFD